MDPYLRGELREGPLDHVLDRQVFGAQQVEDHVVRQAELTRQPAAAQARGGLRGADRRGPYDDTLRERRGEERIAVCVGWGGVLLGGRAGEHVDERDLGGQLLPRRDDYHAHLTHT